eukprot:gene11881-8167_t
MGEMTVSIKSKENGRGLGYVCFTVSFWGARVHDGWYGMALVVANAFRF